MRQFEFALRKVCVKCCHYAVATGKTAYTAIHDVEPYIGRIFGRSDLYGLSIYIHNVPFTR